MHPLWMKMRDHACACVDAQCIVLGIPTVKHPPGGVANPPGLHYRKHVGPVYFEALAERGHSSANFDTCTCKTKE